MAQVQGKRLIVLGAGISGLSFLNYLRNFAAALKKDHMISKVILLEANNYMGGSIKSNVHDDGIVHELGPRSVRLAGVKSQNTVVLLEQLGLADRILPVTSKSVAGQNRYVYASNQLFKIPSSPKKMFKKLPNSRTTLLRAVYTDLFKAPRLNLEQFPYRDPPLYEFIKHRFGIDAAENVADPLLRGITAGNVRELSTRALFGEILEKEQVYGSIIKGTTKPPITKMPHDELFPNDILESKLLDQFQQDKVISYNLRTGLQTLTEHLSNSLLNTNDDGVISIYNNTRVTSVNFDKSPDATAPCSVDVSTIDGDLVKIEGDHIVSAIPSCDLIKTLSDTMLPEHRKALEHLSEITHSPVGCVCVEYRDIKQPVPEVLNSFGFLTRSDSGSRVLGIAFDSAMFPQIDENLGAKRMTCMMGGSWFKEVFGTDDINQVKDSQLEQIALEEIRKILGIKEEPFRMSPYLWKTGIAQYKPGHKERLEEVRENIKKLSIPLTLLGQSYDGVAINDVVFASRMAAYNLVKSM